MSTPVRMTLYVIALAAVFAASLGVGLLVDPSVLGGPSGGGHEGGGSSEGGHEGAASVAVAP